MPDLYDEMVAYYTANPSKIEEDWDRTKPLFDRLGESFLCGCPSQVKFDTINGYSSGNKILDEFVRSLPLQDFSRLPSNLHKLGETIEPLPIEEAIKSLPYFAMAQREANKTLFGRYAKHEQDWRFLMLGRASGR